VGALPNRLPGATIEGVEAAHLDAEEEVQANISRVVRILMAAAGLRHQTDLAHQLGVTDSTVTRKLVGKRPWSLEDLVKLSAIFNQPVRVFVSNPDRVLQQLSTSGYKPNPPLSLIEGTLSDQEVRPFQQGVLLSVVDD